MLPKELIRKIRRIEIYTRSLVESVFSGEYHSVFKGRGMEFDQVREYLEGDDVRSIDWNVTARMNRPFVKEFVEERELTVMLAVDVSGSSDFGTAKHFRSEIAAEICSLLALSAIENNDKVGLLLFSDRIEKSVTPRKGRRHVLRVIRELLVTRPEGRGTDLNGALEHLNRTLKRRAVLFLISDFLKGGSFERLLRVTNKRHDVIALRIVDPREVSMPDVGRLDLEDAETGERLSCYTGEAFRRAYEERNKREKERLHSLFRKTGVDLVEVTTEGGYVDPLVEFFRKRARRRRR